MSLQVDNLYFAYGSQDVLRGVSFQAEKGLCTAVLGINGAGKSTVLKCVGRIHQPREGTVRIGGKYLCEMDRSTVAKLIGYVPQSCELGENTVFDAVLLGRKPYINWDITKEDLQIVERVLRTLKLEGFAMRNVRELSGGERQKVSIARALAQQAKVLLFDEPTSNLDLKNQLEVLQMIRDIVREQNLCAVITIHDINLALRFADRILMMKEGGVYDYGDTNVVTSRAIEEVYGVHVSVIDHHGRKMIIPQ